MVKQQNVVFFIGAGFSAPIGLLVMSNFINKVKDLYFSDVEKYSEISKTLKLIEKYSCIKNIMNIDLLNIEDLLSISYMESLINKRSRLLNHINDFIRIIITSYTPDKAIYGVISFVNFVLNIKLKKSTAYVKDDSGFSKYYMNSPNGKQHKNASYGIISLNYDLIIEQALKELSKLHGIYFIKTGIHNILDDQYLITKNITGTGIPMAKLHGSIDRNIVPPTWNKNINNDIREDWVLATQLLSNATHVIFLGYSLPSTDNYIKFLLASSLNCNKKLKNISIITLDNDGETERRYNSLFSISSTFHNRKIKDF